jgi:hypothetical protein
MPDMVSWSGLAIANPELAAAGERLLWPGHFAAAFLATTRADGGPRVHPVASFLADGALCIFVVDMSPKYADLLRDGRYALHSSLPSFGGEEFYLTGRAKLIEDAVRRRAAVKAAGGLGHNDFERLFELDIRRVLHTRWANWGTPQTWPEYTRWRAP